MAEGQDEKKFKYTDRIDFAERAKYHLEMISGAFSLLECLDYERVCFEDLQKFCFGMVQVNERFQEELENVSRGIEG